MERTLVVSACSYAGARPDVLRAYVNTAFVHEFDSWAAATPHDEYLGNPVTAGQARFDPSYMERVAAAGAVDRAAGVSDATARLAEMDAQGVAADVIYPTFQPGLRPPFDPVHGAGQYAAELQVAGAQAYNRWLAEYCTAAPSRLAGIAIVPLTDVDAAIAEIQWAKDAGLRGILVPSIPGPPMDGMMLPKIGASNPAQDPVWAACEGVDLPVHLVGGTGMRQWGDVPGRSLLDELNWPDAANGALSMLFLGGILEDHPRLRIVLADQGTRRIADTIMGWDATYQSPTFNKYQLKRSPWDYWIRQCHVAPAPLRRSDLDVRHVLGVTQMMWSSRYPQVVGSWLDVNADVRDRFAGMPERDTRAIVADNAIRLYGLDRSALLEVADRMGPEPAALAGV